MKIGREISTLILLIILDSLVYTGHKANALSYDYKATIECLANPPKPQYGGGIIVNAELDEGLKGWSSFGEAKIEHRESQHNYFIVAHTRYQPSDSISQELYLENDKLYTFSAWVQVSSGGNVAVRASFKTRSGLKHAGSVVAESNCWSMLKGGLTLDESGPAHLFFESNNTLVEIWVDSVSLQPFTQEQWKTHQQQSIEKVHKRNVRIQVVGSQGQPLENATISLQQQRPSFPFGCAINANILGNAAYQAWFDSRRPGFTVTTFEDEMKWYTTEPSRGRTNYAPADALLEFAARRNVSVRGHNVFWDDPTRQPSWVHALQREELAQAAFERAFSVMLRYKGRVMSWDVVNENLHFHYFERKVARNASGIFYNWAGKADGAAPLFLNDYNTIECSGDTAVSAARYARKVREIQGFLGSDYFGINGVKMGIGLEGHFPAEQPNIPYVRACIDYLASMGLPVWITELDVETSPNQALYLEQILREVRSHPHVNGIVIWAAWKPQGCYKMCLTDNNFHNLPTGNVVDELLREWGSGGSLSGTTRADGLFEASLFHGDYEVRATHHPEIKNPAGLARTFKVASTSTSAISSHQPSLVLQALD